MFTTKNGYVGLVVMSIETYEAMVENAETDIVISEAEAEFERDHDVRETLISFKRRSKILWGAS